MKTELHIYGAHPYAIENELRNIPEFPQVGVSVYRTDLGVLIYIDVEIPDSILIQMHEVARKNIFRFWFPNLPIPDFPVVVLPSDPK